MQTALIWRVIKFVVRCTSGYGVGFQRSYMVDFLPIHKLPISALQRFTAGVCIRQLFGVLLKEKLIFLLAHYNRESFVFMPLELLSAISKWAVICHLLKSGFHLAKPPCRSDGVLLWLFLHLFKVCAEQDWSTALVLVYKFFTKRRFYEERWWSSVYFMLQSQKLLFVCVCGGRKFLLQAVSFCAITGLFSGHDGLL